MTLIGPSQKMLNSPRGVQLNSVENFLNIQGDLGYWNLIESLKTEIEANDKAEDFGVQLKRFMEDEGEDLRTLQQKLESSGRQHKLKFAQKLEARVNKKLHLYGLYPSGERLLVEIFSFIYVRFNEVVKEMIYEDKKRSEIESYITKEIVDVLKLKINNDTLLSHEELAGMIYHLAQKCFINWDR